MSKAGGLVKKQGKKEAMEAHLGYAGFHGEESVENSKRRHMMSQASGDFKFFERILMMKRFQDPTFISKSSARNR